MKLWILKPVDPDGGPWNPWYDKTFGLVVRAGTEGRARVLASHCCGDEGAPTWLDGNLVSCDALESAGDEEVIIRDFASA